MVIRSPTRVRRERRGQWDSRGASGSKGRAGARGRRSGTTVKDFGFDGLTRDGSVLLVTAQLRVAGCRNRPGSVALPRVDGRTARRTFRVQPSLTSIANGGPFGPLLARRSALDWHRVLHVSTERRPRPLRRAPSKGQRAPLTAKMLPRSRRVKRENRYFTSQVSPARRSWPRSPLPFFAMTCSDLLVHRRPRSAARPPRAARRSAWGSPGSRPCARAGRRRRGSGCARRGRSGPSR